MSESRAPTRPFRAPSSGEAPDAGELPPNGRRTSSTRLAHQPAENGHGQAGRAEPKRPLAWRVLLDRAAVSGSCASLASLAALVCFGHRDCASAFAPVNAISHWVWRDRALHQQDASLRYTVPGYLIHHAMSVLWALLFEASAQAPSAWARSPRIVGSGLAVAGVACFVDLRCTPERLTPGFERRLRPASLAVVYIAFGIGLALPRLRRALRNR